MSTIAPAHQPDAVPLDAPAAGRRPRRSCGAGPRISAWVINRFPATTLGAVAVYDLTAPTTVAGA